MSGSYQMDPNRPRIAPIIREEAGRNGYTPEDIIKDDRTLRVTAVRQYAMWRARQETGRSFPEIARAFRRDHTTVIYSCRKVEKIHPLERGVFAPIEPAPTTRVPTADTFKGSDCPSFHGGIRYRFGGKCVECCRQKYLRHVNSLRAAE